MSKISLSNKAFLDKLNNQKVKIIHTKILLLDKNNHIIDEIQGKVIDGNISVSNSAVRRAGSLSFIAYENQNNALLDINEKLSYNSKVKILIGIENNIDNNYDEIIWFDQGVFVLTQVSITHNNNAVSASITFKDKMALLNGDLGGTLPTSIVFDSYDQTFYFKELTYTDSFVSEYFTNNNKFDPIKFISSLTKNIEVNNYTTYYYKYAEKSYYYSYDYNNGWYEGSSDENKILTVKQTMKDIIYTLVNRFGGEEIDNIIIEDIDEFFRSVVKFGGKKDSKVNKIYFNPKTKTYTTTEDADVFSFGLLEEYGYIYTQLTYPGELISSFGDTVTSVLDKIFSMLGNYEYFYDLDGNFRVRQIKNYQDIAFDPVMLIDGEETSVNYYEKGFSSYKLDFSNNGESIYTFDKNNGLINSYTNNIDYTSLKNDFQIWGKLGENSPLHYHLAIKEKPEMIITRDVYFVEYNNKLYPKLYHKEDGDKEVFSYTPYDWRVELYFQGLEKEYRQQRPDEFEQEILDKLPLIFEFATYKDKDKKIINPKGNYIDNSNISAYWIDYIEPSLLSNYSIDNIGKKTIVYQNDNINKLYDKDVPNITLIDNRAPENIRKKIKNLCQKNSEQSVNISYLVYSEHTTGTYGYSAFEAGQNLLYKEVDFVSSISLTTIPIYYLDVNRQITVEDETSGINGEYIISGINIPLNGTSTMTINAIKSHKRL